MSEKNQDQPVKKRYQLFAKLDSAVSYDNIDKDIERLATPCSPVFELTDEEYALYHSHVRDRWDNRHRIVCLSDNWVTLEDIMQLIDQERSKIAAEKSKRWAENQSRLIASAAKKEAKRQAFAEQCSGANGKVKSSSNTKAEQLPKVFAGYGFRGNR